MLTLLKQARAFGLGVVLATQNPVDLDYKGLANCGTWFLGRLQTERDKLRVLDGLEGASAAAGATFDRAEMEQMLSGLGNRVFLMNNVHEDEPVVFQSRWALSYLRGPLTREQIGKLMAERKATTSSSGLRASAKIPQRKAALPKRNAPSCRRNHRAICIAACQFAAGASWSITLPCLAKPSSTSRKRPPASTTGRMFRCSCRSRCRSSRNLGGSGDLRRSG